MYKRNTVGIRLHSALNIGKTKEYQCISCNIKGLGPYTLP